MTRVAPFIGRLQLVAGLIFSLFAFAGEAQSEFPARPIRLVNPFTAGGPVDVVGRIIATPMAERLGQPVLVESRPGANGNIATEHVARAPADGHTLLIASDGQIVISPHLNSMAIDPRTDLVPIAALGTTDLVLVVNADLQARDLAEFVALARRADPPLTYGSVGHGSQLHLVMEMVKAQAGIDLVHVPYHGGEAMALALQRGEVDAMIGGSGTIDRIRAGSVRGLASAGRQRSEAYLNLPTLMETWPGFEAQAWIALFAPARIPPDVLARLRAELDRILAAPETERQFRRANGFELYRAPPEEFAARVRAEYARYGEVVKRLGISN